MAVPDGSGGFRVEMIDVGKGDSLLLEGPNGTTMLIDSGDYPDRGKPVLDHLDERGIDSLDYLVATHDDADHIGGHAAIVEEFGSDGIGTCMVPRLNEKMNKSRIRGFGMRMRWKRMVWWRTNSTRSLLRLISMA